MRKQTLTVTIPLIARDGLAELARKHDCIRGNTPNISELLTRIGKGQIPVGADAKEQPRNAGYLEALVNVRDLANHAIREWK